MLRHREGLLLLRCILPRLFAACGVTAIELPHSRLLLPCRNALEGVRKICRHMNKLERIGEGGRNGRREDIQAERQTGRQECAV
jgi:hypothetical protein